MLPFLVLFDLEGCCETFISRLEMASNYSFDSEDDTSSCVLVLHSLTQSSLLFFLITDYYLGSIQKNQQQLIRTLGVIQIKSYGKVKGKNVILVFAMLYLQTLEC